MSKAPDQRLLLTRAQKARFARRLSDLMAAKGMTQSELAQRTGIGQDNISRYMSASMLPKRLKLGSIAQALDVEPSDLLPGVGQSACDAKQRAPNVFDLQRLPTGEYEVKIDARLPADLALRLTTLMTDMDKTAA